MNAETIKRLNRLNRVFYEAHGCSFSETRASPWPGWERVLDEAIFGPGGIGHVLDVGCGNGRFADFLMQRKKAARYVGLDVSNHLLSEARKRLDGDGHEFIEHDVLESSWDRFSERQFDLIVVMGLMHHIPGLDNRIVLVSELRQLLSPTGTLAITFWEFLGKGRDRFEAKIVPWRDRLHETGVHSSRVEKGDYLLRWDRDSEGLRYCHYADAAEVELLTPAKTNHRTEFWADGKSGELNRYVLLQCGRS